MSRTRHQRPTVRAYVSAAGTRYWRGEWRVRTASGSRLHRTKDWIASEYSKSAAQKALDELVREETARVRPDGSMTLAQFWARWWPTRQAHLAATTIRTYESHWRTWLAPLHGRKLRDITRHDVDSTIVAMAAAGCGASACAVALYALSSCLEAAWQDEYISRNPARGVEVPRAAQRSAPTRSMSEAEAQRLLASLDASEAILWRLLLLCGLRVSEAFGLRAEDLLEDRRLRLVRQSLYEGGGEAPLKNRRTREVPVPASLWRDLTAHAVRCDGWLFSDSAGNPRYRHSKAAADALHRARLTSGIPDLTYRMARTTYATLYSGDVADIQATLGHHSPEFTAARYRRSVAGRQQQQADELERRLTARPKLRRVK